MPRRISSVRRTMSFAAARSRAIACSATDTLYAPALLHTMADGGNRSNGKWSTPATSDWIIRTFPAFCRRSAGNSRGKPIDTTTSAVDHASSRSSGGRSSRITCSNAPAAAAFATAARRSASIGTMNRTRAIGPPDAAAGLGPFDAARSAFRIAAGVALHAAFLEHEGLAALRALGIQALPQQLRGVAGLLLHLDVCLDGAAELVERLHGRLDSRLLHPDVTLDRLRDRVRDRIHPFPVVDCDPRAADALELVDDLVDRDARPQAQGDEARDPFREGGRVAAAAADLREHPEQAFLVLVGGLARKVDCLGDRGVAPPLESGLHAHVPLRRDVVGRREAPLPLLRDFPQTAWGSVVIENLLHELLPPKSFPLRDLFEIVKEVREFLAVHHPFVPDEAEFRLASSRRVRDHRERSGRCDRGDVGVAKPQAFLLVAAAFPRGVNAALLSELRALIISRFMDKLHDFAAPLDAFLGIVWDLEHEQHPREAHDAKADLSRGVSHLLDLLDRVRVHVDDVIEHPSRRTDRRFEFLPINVPAAGGSTLHVTCKIDRAEVA